MEEFVGYEGRVLGDYVLLSLLGSGGMGAVFRARHSYVGREVAIKLLRRSLWEHHTERFFFEAKAAGQVRCENVVEVLDVKTDPELGPYLVMEYFSSGQSLEDALLEEPRFTERRALHIALQLAKALAAVHAVGVVHRDLKPENIWLLEVHGQCDVVKIFDFGIAKQEGALRRTAEGTMLGTPLYMAPEQCRGGEVDHRADIYAMGLLLFEMLAGRPAFDGATTMEILAKQLSEEAPRLCEVVPQCSLALSDVVQRCLAKEPRDRYASAALLQSALSALGRTPQRMAERRLPVGRMLATEPLVTTVPKRHWLGWLGLLFFCILPIRDRLPALEEAEIVRSTEVREPLWRQLAPLFALVRSSVQMSNKFYFQIKLYEIESERVEFGKKQVRKVETAAPLLRPRESKKIETSTSKRKSVVPLIPLDE